MPWRNTDNPYKIYISEVMLQQTQVATVLARYYHPFLERFPTLQALADADVQDVMKAWEGLGYYRRARHVHEAARASAPHLPRTVPELMQLKGIGRNTAHAIATFAYHLPVPVMEANVKRVLHRLLARAKMTEAELWQAAEHCLDTHDPFTYNQAMMDIGALVCTPKQPRCEDCPLASACAGKTNPTAYPAKTIRAAVPIRTRHHIVFTHDGAIALFRRASALLGGMYQALELEADATHATLGNYTLPIAEMQPLGGITQTYSHFTLDATLWLAELPSKEGTPPECWYSLEEARALPLSRADQKMLAKVKDHFCSKQQ